MPHGFTGLLNPAISSNTAGLDQNCYYCTISALLGTDTHTLVAATEMMQEDTANEDHIISLMRAAGVPTPSYITFGQPQPFLAAVGTLPAGQAVGLAYRRTDGSGHMIVVAHDAFGQRGFIDYQNNPPTVTLAFPEPIANILSMALFFHS